MSGTDPYLRFSVGSHVIFQLINGWFEGEVVSLWPVDIPGACYLIAGTTADEDDRPMGYPIFYDFDTFVRVCPEDKTPDPATLNRSTLPEPNDPYAYEYTGLQNIMNQEERIRLTNELLENHPEIRRVQENPDGTLLLEFNDPHREPVQTTTIALPQEPRHGVPGHAIKEIGFQLRVRRQYSQSVGVIPDFYSLFESIVPTESTLSELEHAAQQDSSKMLVFADALMSGVHGWPRDPPRACNCYLAAAYGCSEEQRPERQGIPVGVPEAFCAAAYIRHLYIKCEILDFHLTDNIPAERLLALATLIDDRHVINVLHEIFFWLSSAVVAGWVCPLALEYAEAAESLNMENDDPILESCIEKLFAANSFRKKEVELEQRRKEEGLPRGDPSSAVLEKFGPKASEIFEQLPVLSTIPFGTVACDIHIEFREVPVGPNPVFVFVVMPSTKTVIKLIKLPDRFQLCPFSEDAFELIWLLIAFELRLGSQDTNTRFRPAVFTVLDRNGDKEFGRFLGQAAGGPTSGTEVRFASHGDMIILADTRRRPKSLGDIMQGVESSFIRNMREFLTVERQFESVRSIAQEESSAFHSRDSTTTQQTVQEALRLKDEGKDLFSLNRYVAARRCYADAIQLVKTFVNPNDASYRLLGTLLSNRAACYLKIVENVSPDAGIYLMKDAILDCTVGLESTWSHVLPMSIRHKLSWRRDAAMAKKELLTLDVEQIHTNGGAGTGVDTRNVDRGQQRRRRNRRGRQDNRRNRRRDRERQMRHHRRNIEQHTVDEPDMRSVDYGGETEECIVALGPELVELKMASNALEAADVCPICIGRFSVELREMYTTILPCGHAHCMSCVVKLKMIADRSSSGGQPTTFCCSLCRLALDSNYLRVAGDTLVTNVESLHAAMHQLPLLSDVEKKSVVLHLLENHSFQLDKVFETIADMLLDQAQDSLWQREDLSYEQKNEIYKQARRPEQLLRQELVEIQSQRDSIRDYESKERSTLDELYRETRAKLLLAQRNASRDIFDRMNTAGVMGRQQTETSDLSLDFHGLHIKEALEKFDDTVVPILPALGRVRLVTGRGCHSVSGTSVLKRALTGRIEADRKMRWERVSNNDGAIIVKWVARS